MKKELPIQIKEASIKLMNHGVVSFATETVMGLGCLYNDKIAYDKMNIIKRRPEDKPYTLMLSKVEDIEKYAYINERDKKIINAFLPGALTILVNKKDNVPSYVTHNTNIIGIRVPDFDIPRLLIDEVGYPLLVPSANKSGEKPALNSVEVKEIFKDELDYIIDSSSIGGKPSTIIDLTQKEYKIIREGPITKEMIEQVLKG